MQRLNEIYLPRQRQKARDRHAHLERFVIEFPGENPGPTGLEPATSCVTGRRSNQLSYDPRSSAAETTAENLEYSIPPRRSPGRLSVPVYKRG